MDRLAGFGENGFQASLPRVFSRYRVVGAQTFDDVLRDVCSVRQVPANVRRNAYIPGRSSFGNQFVAVRH